MPDSTQTLPLVMNPFQQLLDDPTYSVPTGDELYNKLMQGIEPELMTANLDGLKEKYKNETQAETAERAARYDKAFAEYEKQLKIYLADMAHNLQKIQRTAAASLEKRDRINDANAMQSLESQFSTF